MEKADVPAFAALLEDGITWHESTAGFGGDYHGQRPERPVLAVGIAVAPAHRGITTMTAHHTEPSRSPRGEHGRQQRGVACAAHVFNAHVRADPGLVWAALTDPAQTAAHLYGLAAHSTWVPGDPIEFRLADRVEAIGCVFARKATNGCPTCCKPGRATRRCT